MTAQPHEPAKKCPGCGTGMDPGFYICPKCMTSLPSKIKNRLDKAVRRDKAQRTRRQQEIEAALAKALKHLRGKKGKR